MKHIVLTAPLDADQIFDLVDGLVVGNVLVYVDGAKQEAWTVIHRIEPTDDSELAFTIMETVQSRPGKLMRKTPFARYIPKNLAAVVESEDLFHGAVAKMRPAPIKKMVMVKQNIVALTPMELLKGK